MRQLKPSLTEVYSHTYIHVHIIHINTCAIALVRPFVDSLCSFVVAAVAFYYYSFWPFEISYLFS